MTPETTTQGDGAVTGADFTELLALLGDATVVLDKDGHILCGNPQVGSLFGRALASFIGIPGGDLFKDTSASWLLQIEGELALRKVWCSERVGVRDDGKTFPCEVSASRIKRRQGEFVILRMRDLTLRKEAEAQLNKFR